MEIISSVKICNGTLRRISHDSSSTKTKMTFAVFTPPTQCLPTQGFPALYWLSGLTCTDKNFSEKASPAFAMAASEGIAIVMPDTSPRGAGIDGEDDAYDFGSGAGFYVDATKAPWSTNYNMYSYVTEELPALLAEASPAYRISPLERSIAGHSMCGHGALTIAFKAPAAWASVSALAPIVDPTASCGKGPCKFSLSLVVLLMHSTQTLAGCLSETDPSFLSNATLASLSLTHSLTRSTNPLRRNELINRSLGRQSL